MAYDLQSVIHTIMEVAEVVILFVMVASAMKNYAERKQNSLLLFAVAFFLLFFQDALELAVALHLVLDIPVGFAPLFRVLNNSLEVFAALVIFYAIVAPLFSARKRMLARAIYAVMGLTLVLGIYRIATSTQFEVVKVYQASWFTIYSEAMIIAILAAITLIAFRTWSKTKVPIVMFFFVATASWLLSHFVTIYNALFGGGLFGKVTLGSVMFRIIALLLLAYYVSSTLKPAQYIKGEFTPAKIAKFLSYVVAAGFVGFIIYGGATLPTALKASPIGSDTLATQEVVRIEAYINFAKEELFKAQARIKLVLQLLPLGQYDSTDSELHELDLRIYSSEAYLGLASDAGVNPAKIDELLHGVAYYGEYSKALKAINSGLKEERALEEGLVATQIFEERKDYARQIQEKLGKLKASAASFRDYVNAFSGEHPDYARDKRIFLDTALTVAGMNSLYLAFEDAESQVMALQQDSGRLKAISRVGILNLSNVSLQAGSGQSQSQSIEEVLKKKVENASNSEAIRTLAGSLVGKCSPADDACRVNAMYDYSSNSIKYVKDPVSFDYVAEATETILTRAGDCEDKSILLAGLLKVIGESPRLVVLTRPDTGRGHVFVTIKVDDLNAFRALAPKGAGIYYLPKDENYWIAMETTAQNAYVGYEDQAVINQCDSFKCKEISLG